METVLQDIETVYNVWL